MAFFNKKTSKVFLVIIFLLIACVVAGGFYIHDSRKDYDAVLASLSTNQAELAAAQANIDTLKAKISEADQNSKLSAEQKAELESQLQQALDTKAQLEKENTELKSQIEQLKKNDKQVELERQIALGDCKQTNTTKQGVCYLTFDDGPSSNTVKILDVLDTYNVKATFFVVGDGSTQYMKQIVNRGHAIGLHTSTHKYNQLYKSVTGYLEDFKAISDKVYNATGVRSNIMRFPGGGSNTISANYCKGIMSDLTVRMKSLGYSYYDWNVDSGDANTSIKSSDQLVQNVLNGAKGKNSICVLMHDAGANTLTVQALPRIIEGLKNMGFTFVPITADVYGYYHPIQN